MLVVADLYPVPKVAAGVELSTTTIRRVCWHYFHSQLPPFARECRVLPQKIDFGQNNFELIKACLDISRGKNRISADNGFFEPFSSFFSYDPFGEVVVWEVMEFCTNFPAQLATNI